MDVVGEVQGVKDKAGDVSQPRAGHAVSVRQIQRPQLQPWATHKPTCLPTPANLRSHHTFVQHCCTATGTRRTIREGREPRTATATFTQLVSSVNLSPMLLHVHRDHTDYWGQGAQDGNVNFRTAP